MSKLTQAPVAEKAVKVQIALPDAERGLGAYHIARFDKLKRRLLRTDLKPTQREAALDELASLEHTPKQSAERQAIDAAIEETVRLARANGEDVSVDKKTGQVRVMSRGGLHQAWRDGHLDHPHGSVRADDLYEAGRRYREAYETAEGATTGEKGAGGFGPKGPQVKLIEAGQALKAMRDALTDRQRAVIDLVCGKDVRLRTAADDLRRGFPGVKNSLRGGLSALAAMKLDKPKGMAEEVRAKTDAITKAQNAA